MRLVINDKQIWKSETRQNTNKCAQLQCSKLSVNHLGSSQFLQRKIITRMAKLISFRNFGDVIDSNNACCSQIFPVGQDGIEKIQWGKSSIDLFYFNFIS